MMELLISSPSLYCLRHSQKRAATNFSNPKGRMAWLSDKCPESQTWIARLQVQRFGHYNCTCDEIFNYWMANKLKYFLENIIVTWTVLLGVSQPTDTKGENISSIWFRGRQFSPAAPGHNVCWRIVRCPVEQFQSWHRPWCLRRTHGSRARNHPKRAHSSDQQV